MKYQKTNKYFNVICKYNGITFHSKKEKDYYLKLKMLEKAGKIKDLRLQVKYELLPNFKFNNKTIRSINYIADFVYYDIGQAKEIIVDTKGYRTEVYKLKKKMMMYKGYEVEEV